VCPEVEAFMFDVIVVAVVDSSVRIAFVNETTRQWRPFLFPHCGKGNITCVLQLPLLA